jgi:hypothetical protein
MQRSVVYIAVSSEGVVTILMGACEVVEILIRPIRYGRWRCQMVGDAEMEMEDKLSEERGFSCLEEVTIAPSSTHTSSVKWKVYYVV